MNFKFPGSSHQTTIIGRTGSGKSRMGAWILANSSFDVRPWVIVDYKREPLFARIGDDRIRELSLDARPPKRPGLYIIRPRLNEQEGVENFLWRVWERGNTGLFFDEGYMAPKEQAFDTIMTQGRSLKIPRIILVQRPSRVSRFVFSEASYYCVFHLNDRRDRKIVEEFLPETVAETVIGSLPRYNSLWYDANQDTTFRLTPCPSDDVILATLRSRAPLPFWRS